MPGKRTCALRVPVRHSPAVISTRYITMQPLPAETWEAEVNKMIKTFGMTNPEGVAPKIIKYLQEHYTPETRKR